MKKKQETKRKKYIFLIKTPLSPERNKKLNDELSFSFFSLFPFFHF